MCVKGFLCVFLRPASPEFSPFPQDIITNYFKQIQQPVKRELVQVLLKLLLCLFSSQSLMFQAMYCSFL